MTFYFKLKCFIWNWTQGNVVYLQAYGRQHQGVNMPTDDDDVKLFRCSLTIGITRTAQANDNATGLVFCQKQIRILASE